LCRVDNFKLARFAAQQKATFVHTRADLKRPSFVLSERVRPSRRACVVASARRRDVSAKNVGDEVATLRSTNQVEGGNERALGEFSGPNIWQLNILQLL
jgi:hypothetical protein